MDIRRLSTDDEAQWCAELMSGSEPWITLGRSFEQALVKVRDPGAEVYLVAEGAELLGFLILQVRGAFVGYIQTVAVAAGARSRGVGSKLIAFAEERCFREFPNVFMCVSSFNGRARELYERLGYVQVGELPDFMIEGHSELLLRKTRGPIMGWKP